MLIAIYKSAAKVQLFFDIRKDLHKKTHPKMRFSFYVWFFLSYPATVVDEG